MAEVASQIPPGRTWVHQALKGGGKEELVGARVQLGLHNQNTDINCLGLIAGGILGSWARSVPSTTTSGSHHSTEVQTGWAPVGSRRGKSPGGEGRCARAGQGRPAHPCPGGTGSLTAGR